MLRLLAIGLLLLAILLFADFETLVWQFKEVRLPYLVAFVLISLPMIWASSKKWQLFVGAQGASVSTSHLMRLYTVSYFVNLVSPSTLGGDVVRSISLGKFIENQSASLIAVFLERLTGLIAMLVVVGLSYCVSVQVREILGIYGFISVIIFLALGSSILFERTRRVFSFALSKLFFIVSYFAPEFGKKLNLRIGEKFLKLLASIAVSWKLVLLALFWSLVFHFFAVVNVYLAGLTINCFQLNFSELMFVVPLALLLLTVPITPGAIGVQEGIFYLCLTKLGASSSEALAIALLLRAKGIFLALIGALLIPGRRKVTT